MVDDLQRVTFSYAVICHIQYDLGGNDLTGQHFEFSCLTSFPEHMPATAFARPPDLKEANQPCTGFIAPIIYRYEGGVMVEEYHLGGNLIIRADQHQLPRENNPIRTRNKIMNLICRQVTTNETSSTT